VWARKYDSGPDAKLGPTPADFLKRKADDQIARESKWQAKATLLVEALLAVTTAVWEKKRAECSSELPQVRNIAHDH
jgi:hypothetical protein